MASPSQKITYYDPIFGVVDELAPGLGTVDVGEIVEAILNYRVIERTKNYVILKVDFVHAITKSRRM